MRGIAYALLASCALALGAMTAGPAAAGCYHDECGYDRRSPSVTYYRSAPQYSHYDDRRYYRESAPTYREYAPTYRTTYYDRPAYKTYHERPVYRTSHYHDGYYDRPHYSYSRPYYRKHYHSYRRYYPNYYPTVRYGGGWTQTGYGYHGSGYAYGGCHTAYIPYGWTWYRARNC